MQLCAFAQRLRAHGRCLCEIFVAQRCCLFFFSCVILIFSTFLACRCVGKLISSISLSSAVYRSLAQCGMSSQLACARETCRFQRFESQIPFHRPAAGDNCTLVARNCRRRFGGFQSSYLRFHIIGCLRFRYLLSTVAQLSLPPAIETRIHIFPRTHP